MPELPELETITTQLNKVLKHKVIKSVQVLRPSSFIGDHHLLLNKKIKSITRRAKMGLIQFQEFEQFLLIHLKMTGQLVYVGKTRVAGGHPTPDFINVLPSPHTRVIINFSDNTTLYFNDQRAFGWLKIVSREDYQKLINKLPPDVVDKDFTLQFFQKLLSRSMRPIKLTIMDQAKIGGVGNIYANDALLLAKIDPRRPAKSLTSTEIKLLHQKLIEVINKGIKYGGASYSHYVDTTGTTGKYQHYFIAYDQEGKLCSQCQTATIKKFTLGGRGTYYCEVCQK